MGLGGRCVQERVKSDGFKRDRREWGQFDLEDLPLKQYIAKGHLTSTGRKDKRKGCRDI